MQAPYAQLVRRPRPPLETGPRFLESSKSRTRVLYETNTDSKSPIRSKSQVSFVNRTDDIPGSMTASKPRPPPREICSLLNRRVDYRRPLVRTQEEKNRWVAQWESSNSTVGIPNIKAACSDDLKQFVRDPLCIQVTFG